MHAPPPLGFKFTFLTKKYFYQLLYFADSNKWYVFKDDNLTQFLEIHTSEAAYTEDNEYILLLNMAFWSQNTLI